MTIVPQIANSTETFNASDFGNGSTTTSETDIVATAAINNADVILLAASISNGGFIYAIDPSDGSFHFILDGQALSIAAPLRIQKGWRVKGYFAQCFYKVL